MGGSRRADGADLTAAVLDRAVLGPHAALAVVKQIHLGPRVKAALHEGVKLPVKRLPVECALCGLRNALGYLFLLLLRY